MPPTLTPQWDCVMIWMFCSLNLNSLPKAANKKKKNKLCQAQFKPGLCRSAVIGFCWSHIHIFVLLTLITLTRLFLTSPDKVGFFPDFSWPSEVSYLGAQSAYLGEIKMSLAIKQTHLNILWLHHAETHFYTIVWLVKRRGPCKVNKIFQKKKINDTRWIFNGVTAN